MQERQCKVLEFKAYEVAEEVKLSFISLLWMQGNAEKV